MNAKEMGKFIASRRKELHMTQAELGAKVGVTDKAISRWERGVGFPDLGLFDVLAESIGVTSAELLAGKMNEVDNDLAGSEVAESAIELFEDRIRKVKRYSLVALLWSMGTAIIGTGAVNYFVDDLKIRGLMLVLMWMTVGWVNATNSRAFGREGIY